MKLYSVKMRASLFGDHISGAERIVNEKEIEKTVLTLVRRAFSHSRGVPDFVNLKIELVKEQVENISLLPIWEVRGKYISLEVIKRLSSLAGISPVLVERTYKQLLIGPAPDGKVMRGAMIVRVSDGARLEPDKHRGVRATLFDAKEEVVEKLKKEAGTSYTENLKDAALLSSKILNFEGVLAELCVSDDPDYTTGYFSVKGLGYFRLFNIKERGNLKGGRAIFVAEKCNVKELIEYLQKKPVLITSFTSYSVISPEDISTLSEKKLPV